MLLATFVILLALALPAAVIILLISARTRIQLLEREVELLRRDQRALRQAVAGQAPAPSMREDEIPAPEPVLLSPAARAPEPAAVREPVPPPGPAVEAAPTPTPAPAPAPATGAWEPRQVSTETLIGGLWLQNVGSVLVLLGVFFLILWGYRTGHLGPGALVAAAIAAGVIVAWRGDRMARQLPMLGHALVGVGLGIVYLSLYLGHFVLHVLPTGVAYTSLAVVSFIGLHLGRHYRVQVIQALAVLGAFTPYVAPILVGGGHEPVTPGGLLAYLALVNVAVFALVLQGGFSALALESLVFTTVTWLTATAEQAWGPWTTAGLALVFLGFGHSPLPRLARDPEIAADPIEAVVVVASPFLFLLAAGSWIARLSPHGQGWFLLGMAVIEGLAAAWIERRRGRRDVWYGLVGAAVLYLTAALERLVGSTLAPLAWTIEGVALVAVGLGVGSGWLRALGGMAAGLGVLASAAALAGRLFLPPLDPSGAVPPLLTATSLRGLLEIGLLFAGERLYRLHRASVAGDEAGLGRVGFGGLAQALLFVWLGRFALRVAAIQVTLTHGAAATAPGAAAAQQLGAIAMFLGTSIAAAAWMLQALVLLLRGVHGADGLRRALGYAAAAGAGCAFLVALFEGISSTAWSAGDLPVIHPAGLFQALFLGLVIVFAMRLDGLRARLDAVERHASEAATLALNFLALLWSAQQASRLADVLPAQGSVHVAAVATSAAWIVQAVLLVAIGWGRAASFLRWIGLTILGITLLKVLLVDLSEVGVFWRFVVAIGFGVVLMLVSYAYQRSQRRAHGPGGPPRA